MIKRIPISLLTILLTVQAIFGAIPADEQLSSQDRVFMATQIYSDINIYFADFKDDPGLNLDNEYKLYLKAILVSDSRKDFDLATMAFIAKLGNGHTWFGDWWLRKDRGQQLGFYAHPIDNEWVITESSIESVKPGDVIARIDNEEITEFYQKNKQYLFASDERWRMRALFESPFLFPQTFQMSMKDGKQVQITRTLPFAFHGDEYKENSVSKIGDSLYIRIPSFSNSVFESSAINEIKSMGKVKALILDLRGNHGGQTIGNLVQALMDKSYRPWSESTSVSIGLFRSWGMLNQQSTMTVFGGTQSPRKPIYTGPLYILVDDGCYSACEDTVQPFKDNHRAIIVGERTAGSSGTQYIRDFGNGMAMGLVTRRKSFPNGAQFEGIGIAPDIEVHRTQSDIASGRDPVLAKVLEMVSKPE